MQYYDKLNTVLKNSLSDPKLQYQLKYFDEITKLTRIIIDSTPILSIKNYSSPLPLNESIKTVLNFFYYINPEYAYMFQNVLEEKNIYNGNEDYSIRFHKIEDGKRNNSKVSSNGEVHIEYSETLDDIFTIGHEITHKFSQQKDQDSTIKQFLGETSTITIEFLLQDYLLENTEYDSNELTTRKNNRLIETYDDAGAILFENILLDLYQKNNNCITQEILLDYLNSLDKNSKIYKILSTRGEKYLSDIVNSGSLQFNRRQRYVIGTLLASDFHIKIKENPERISELFSLIDILGHTDLSAESDLKILSNSSIPIINDNKIIASENDITRLLNGYIKEVNDIINQQEKHTM